jgi:hypothetical protein
VVRKSGERRYNTRMNGGAAVCETASLHTQHNARSRKVGEGVENSSPF